jgi:predicted metal-dependent peptidase
MKITDDLIDNLMNIGVSVFKYGDTLKNEVIFNIALSKVDIEVLKEENDMPELAYVTIKNNKPYMFFNAYKILKEFSYVYENEEDENERKLKQIALLRGIMKHELLHIILKHLIKNNKRNIHLLVNIVQDALININIKEFGVLNIKRFNPEDIIELTTSNDNLPGLLVPRYNYQEMYSWEQYYDELYNKLRNNMENTENILSQIEISDLFKKVSGDLKGSDELSEEAEEIMEQLLEEAKNRMQGTKIGNMIEKLTIKRQNKTTIKWQKHLKNNILRGGTYVRSYSYKRFNKRYGTIPGSKMKLKGMKIRVFIDTSASMSKDDLKYILNELYTGHAKYNHTIEGYLYDVEITKTFTEREIKRAIKEGFEIKGRGGTHLIEAIKEYTQTNGELSTADLTIIATDGYDYIPDLQLLKTKKVIFLLTNKHSKEYEEFAKEIGNVYVLENKE